MKRSNMAYLNTVKPNHDNTIPIHIVLAPSLQWRRVAHFLIKENFFWFPCTCFYGYYMSFVSLSCLYPYITFVV